MIARLEQNTIDYPLPHAHGAAGDTQARAIPVLQILLRRRWTILLTTVACIVGAVVYLVIATPIYTSTSRVYVDPGTPGAFSDQAGASVKSDSYQYTQAQMLSSNPILSSAIDAVNAHSMKTFSGVDGNLLVYLKRKINVEVGKKDDIISISFDSPYPAEAAALVNAIVDAYVTYESGQKHSTADKMLVILQKEKAARDKDLDAQMKQAVAFRQKNGALSFDTDKGNIVMDKLGQLTVALTQAQVDTIAAKRECAEAKKMSQTPEGRHNLVQLYQSKGWNSEDKGYTDLQASLAQLRADYVAGKGRLGSDNPHQLSLTVAMDDIIRQILGREQELSNAYVADLERQVKTAQTKQDELKGMADAQQRVALELNAKATEYDKMLDDIKRTQTECDMLENRIREIAVTGNTGSLNINIVEPARVEEKPSKPRKPIVLSLAMLAGLLLGGGLGLTREWMDHRLRSPDDASEALGLAVLGVVPEMPRKQSIPARGRTVQLEPMSIISEAFRTIRTAVFFSAPAENCTTILVTSPEPGDGKSTVASNLAIAMAQAGHRTLLIDADFRRPTQHAIFELDRDMGANSVLECKATLREAISATSINTLHVLPCGPLPQNPSEILNGKRFEKMMQVLSSHYDKVVIDSPPVSAVADASILAASADICLLVLRAEKSTRRGAAQARDRLIGVGGTVLGVIFNGLSKKSRAYYYSGYNYQSYASSEIPSQEPDSGHALNGTSIHRPALVSSVDGGEGGAN